PDHKLLDLPCYRHREFIHEADVSRNLVMSDLTLAEIANSLFRHRCATAHFDPRAQLFSILRVRDTHHLSSFNLVMAKEKFLDFSWVNVLSAAYDHIFNPADNVAIALFVKRGDVPSMHPSRGINGFCRLFRVVPVSEHHRIASRQQLARRASRHDSSFAVHNLHFQMRLDAPHGRHSPYDGIVNCRLKAHRARLCHAVRDGDIPHVHAIHHAPHHFNWAR